MSELLHFEVGDTVLYNNPCTKTFDQIEVTGIFGVNGDRQRFNGKQIGGKIQNFFQWQAFILGAKVEGVVDIIKRREGVPR